MRLQLTIIAEVFRDVFATGTNTVQHTCLQLTIIAEVFRDVFAVGAKHIIVKGARRESQCLRLLCHGANDL